ncbi:MAG: AraC family transcriptional regulator [Clostridiales bacterium]|nr:AraC family transcriptional regulator [Clostridiales bacterium]
MAPYHGVSLKKCINLSTLYTLYDAIYEHNHSSRGERHDHWEILCVLDGEIEVASGGDVHRLTKGQMIMHKPGEGHSFWSTGNKRPHVAIIGFNADIIPNTSRKIHMLFPHHIDELKKLIAKAHEIFEFSDNAITGREIESPYATALFASKLECLLLSVLCDESKSLSGNAKKYALILDAMKKNLNKNLTINELASLCNMSASSLKKIFSAYSKTGVISYFNSLKIKKAIAMLSEGSRICEIAAELGFEEQNYFSTFFKRITGYSPLNYKKRFLNK